MSEEIILKVRKKGITVLPKRLREAAGIEEDTEIKAIISPGGILLRPLSKDPVEDLGNILQLKHGDPISSQSSVVRIRKLRKTIDRQIRSSIKKESY